MDFFSVASKNEYVNITFKGAAYETVEILGKRLGSFSLLIRSLYLSLEMVKINEYKKIST